MSFRRYVASGRGKPAAIVAVLGAAVAGGVVVGAIEGLVNEWFSLLVLFPLVIGGVAGGVAAWMIGRQHLRAPLLATLLGFAGGAAGYATVHAVDYLQFRSEVSAAIAHEVPSAGAVNLDALMAHETGHDGFRGYLELAARNGVSIKRMGHSDNGFTLTGTGAWILWLVELLLAGLMAGFIARSRAKEPFCEDCDAWFGPTRVIAAGGTATRSARRELLSALEIGDADRAAALLGPPSLKETFVLKARLCPRCASDAYCTLDRVIHKAKGDRTTELESWLLSSSELAQLGSAIERAKPRAAGAMPAA